MEKYMSPMLPNSTQIPDVILDVWLSRLNGSELKVVLYLARRTYGFRKSSDPVSINQFLVGIKCADGRVLDAGTGLAESTLRTALASLLECGLICKTEVKRADGGSAPSLFSLNLNAVPPPDFQQGGTTDNREGGTTDNQHPQHTVTNKQKTPIVPSGDETDSSEDDEASGLEIATYPKFITSRESSAPRLAKDHPTFRQDFDRIWKRYNDTRQGTPKKAAETRASKFSLDDWDTFKTTFDSWMTEWESMASTGRSQYIPHLSTHMIRDSYRDPFRGGKGIVSPGTQRAAMGKPEGFTPPFPDHPGRINRFSESDIHILRDLDAISKPVEIEYTEMIAMSEARKTMGLEIETRVYLRFMEIDKAIKEWLDSGGREKVRAHNKSRQG